MKQETLSSIYNLERLRVVLSNATSGVERVERGLTLVEKEYEISCAKLKVARDDLITARGRVIDAEAALTDAMIAFVEGFNY